MVPLRGCHDASPRRITRRSSGRLSAAAYLCVRRHRRHVLNAAHNMPFGAHHRGRPSGTSDKPQPCLVAHGFVLLHAPWVVSAPPRPLLRRLKCWRVGLVAHSLPHLIPVARRIVRVFVHHWAVLLLPRATRRYTFQFSSHRSLLG